MEKFPENVVATKAGHQNDNHQTPSLFENTASLRFFLLLLLALMMNIIPLKTSGVNGRMSGYPAIIELANAGMRGTDTIINKRGLYLALGQVAPGAKIILPAGCTLDIAQIHGLGRARKVYYTTYDPETAFKDFDPTAYVMAEYNADSRLGPGPFAIARGKWKPDTMVLLRRHNVWYMVDASLLPPPEKPAL